MRLRWFGMRGGKLVLQGKCIGIAPDILYVWSASRYASRTSRYCCHCCEMSQLSGTCHNSPSFFPAHFSLQLDSVHFQHSVPTWVSYRERKKKTPDENLPVFGSLDFSSAKKPIFSLSLKGKAKISIIRNDAKCSLSFQVFLDM